MSVQIEAEDREFLWRCNKCGYQIVQGAACYNGDVVKPLYPRLGWGCCRCNPIGSGRYEVVCELTDICPECYSPKIRAECEVEQQREGPVATSGISYECDACGAMFSNPLKIQPIQILKSKAIGDEKI